MTERENTGTSVEMVWFFAGALLGAGLALLYAPKTGRELREQVNDYTNDAMEKVKEFGSEAQEKVKSSYNRGKEIVGEKTARFSQAAERAESTFH